MAIQTIGGVVAGDASKEDGGVVKAAFNVTKTAIKYPVTDFSPGRYIVTAVGRGTPSLSTYTGTAISGLPSFIMGKEGTGVGVFDLASAADGLLVQGFDGAITLKTWPATAQVATIEKPAQVWTYADRREAYAPNDAEATTVYEANGILMVGTYNNSHNAFWMSQDQGLTWEQIRLPRQHNFPRHGGFLYDSNLEEWWISPRGANYWYVVSHSDLINSASDRVPFVHKYKMNWSTETRGIVTGGNAGAPYRNGDSYDQLYKITNDIWFSNLNSQDILRTGDGGVTWQEYRITAQPISPTSAQPSGHFDHGVFNGSELVQSVRQNGNGHVVRITNFLSVAGPTIQSMDIADVTIYSCAYNTVNTVFGTSNGLYKLQNSTTNLTQLTGNDYSSSRQWHFAWTGNLWCGMDRQARGNFYRIFNQDPFMVTAYDADTQPDGRMRMEHSSFTHINQSILRGNSNDEIWNQNAGTPTNFRISSMNAVDKPGGGKRLLAFGYNNEWYDNTYDWVQPLCYSDDEGENWTMIANPVGRNNDGVYEYNIGGSNGSGLLRIAKGIQDVNQEGDGVFSLDGGKTWEHPNQFIQRNPDWYKIWYKRDDDRDKTSHLRGGICTEDGKMVILWYMNNTSMVLQSFDDGETWNLWKRNEVESANAGKGADGKDIGNLGHARQVIYTPSGRFYAREDGTIFSWSEFDFSDLINHNSLNDRLGEFSGGTEGGLAYGDGKVICIGERSEIVGVIFDDPSNRTPAVFDHPGYEINFNGVAYGNGVFVAVARTRSQYADYLSNATMMYSTDGITWTLTAQPWMVRGNDRSEWANSLTFTGSYFVYRGYGWKQAFRSADGINWEPFAPPYNEQTDEATYDGTGFYQDANHWAQNDWGSFLMYDGTLYYYNYRGQLQTSSASQALTA